jgi:hypothetical protein
VRGRIIPASGVLATLAVGATPAFATAPAPAAITHEYLSRITAVPAEGPHRERVPLPGKLSGGNCLGP